MVLVIEITVSRHGSGVELCLAGQGRGQSANPFVKTVLKKLKLSPVCIFTAFSAYFCVCWRRLSAHVDAAPVWW